MSPSMADILNYLYVVANREVPLWLRRHYDADDAVSETLLEAWQADQEGNLRWLRTALLNNIRNAIRANARTTAMHHAQRMPGWFQRASGYRKPADLSREPSPEYRMTLAEGLASLSPRQRRILLGDEPASKGSFRMVQSRAKEKLCDVA